MTGSEESRALFLRAHALSANARAHRGLGFVAFELRQYPDCVQHLEAALASQVKPLTGELRSEAEAILGRALAFVDRLKIDAVIAAVAQSYCRDLRLEGGGFRLPTAQELRTILDVTRASPAIDPIAFPDTPAASFWTSTPLR